mgnify:CR=1 FL=1
MNSIACYRCRHGVLTMIDLDMTLKGLEPNKPPTLKDADTQMGLFDEA